ncbi:MAG: hypothetical protein K0M56_07680 [Kaistella sp.]|nr:hypothetical protein [Kaistella sp.]
MKSSKIITFLILLFFSTKVCSQNYEWKKIDDGLYLNTISEPVKSNDLSKKDSLLVTLFIFHPNEEINLESSKNKTMLKDKKMSYDDLAKMFNKPNIKLKKKSEYLLKNFNEKNIQQYDIKLKDSNEKDYRELRQYIKEKYGIESEENFVALNDQKESIIFSSTIQPYAEINTEDLKTKFNNIISEIKSRKPYMKMSVYQLKTN